MNLRGVPLATYHHSLSCLEGMPLSCPGGYPMSYLRDTPCHVLGRTGGTAPLHPPLPAPGRPWNRTLDRTSDRTRGTPSERPGTLKTGPVTGLGGTNTPPPPERSCDQRLGRDLGPDACPLVDRQTN